MSIYQQILLSIVIYALLTLASIALNRHIDGREELFDGETATWVILGTLYTIVGAAAVTMIWWHEMDAIALPWQGGAAIFLIVLLSFSFSGLPMYIGDAKRSQKRRKEQGQ